MRHAGSTLKALRAAALAAVVLISALALPAAAQSTPEMRVAVAVIPPFVMQQPNGLSGFAIDLWNAVAARLNWKTHYEVMPDASAILDAMRKRQIDVIATPVVITAARDAEFDFSLAIMQSGLEIMVRDTGETVSPNPLAELLRLLFSETTAVWLGIALVLVLIPGHVVWLFERRYKGGIIDDTRYFPGIFQAIYWAISCLTAQAETMPHQWVARTLSIFWMFAGVVFVAFYTAQLTTTMTVRQIQGTIDGPDDLPGKQVATVAGSTAADYLRAQNAKVMECAQPAQMFQALLNKKVDAVVFTAPALLYYASHEGRRRVRIVGQEFNTAPIAFVYQLNSPLRKKVDGAILALREDGSYQQLYSKWFGNQ